MAIKKKATAVSSSTARNDRAVVEQADEARRSRSLAIHIVPDLLHPLFGSIPVNLHLDHVVWSLFFLQVVLHGSLPASSTKLDIDMNLASVLLGIDLMVAVRVYKKISRIAGNLGGSVGGAVGTLIVLLGPVIVLGTGTFVHNAELLYRRYVQVQGGNETGLARPVLAFLFTGLVKLGFIGLKGGVGQQVVETLQAMMRPELQHPITAVGRFLQLLLLALLAVVTMSLVRPIPFPYTIALPPTPAPPGAPIDRPAPAIKILNSTRSLTGQIVVGENVEYGFRFLRCDHSLLGGRWVRKDKDGQDEFGESIFSTFVLQDAVKLVERTSLDRKQRPNAEIIGLGVGIAAHALMMDGVLVQITEIDPAVYHAAHHYFGLRNPTRLVLDDGARSIETRAAAIRSAGRLLRPRDQTDYVIHDCFTGGSVPAELFTKEFWWDLTMTMKPDGVLVVNFAGILQSRASQAVLATLHDVFPQCRAFRDSRGAPPNATGKELLNMVIFCTLTHSPLLTFRPPSARDLETSPFRREVLTTFLPHEIPVDELLRDTASSFWLDDGARKDGWKHNDYNDDDEDDDEDVYYRPDEPHARRPPLDTDLILRRGRGMDQLDRWQVDSAKATWLAMRNIMPVEAWLAY